MERYQRFHPDLWTTVFNEEAIAVVVSEADDELRVAGHFRTTGDYVGLVWHSDDCWSHEAAQYDGSFDYRDVIWEFSPEYQGRLTRYDDVEIQPAAVIRSHNAAGEVSESYVALGLCGNQHAACLTFRFTDRIDLPHTWIDPASFVCQWQSPDGRSAKIQEDYEVDFIRGIYYPAAGAIPYNAEVTVQYVYNTHETYRIDFNQLYEGTHVTDLRKIPVTDIDTIMLPVLPENFAGEKLIFTGRSDSFDLVLKTMKVVNGELNFVQPARAAHPYRLAEGFDDECDKNPRRLIEQMRILGYEGTINFYIGASHFYDKKGQAGEIACGVEQLTLDPEQGINYAFKTWLTYYLRAMKANGFNQLIVSISMECLQMPEDWKQRMYQGVAGQTGWQPATAFYSPCNEEVRLYVRKITKEILDIVVAEGFPPLLQLGESWFWWQEFLPGAVDVPYEGRPPCFYDAATKARFKKELGYELPVYRDSDIPLNAQTKVVALKLQQYLGEYTLFMRSIAAEYADSQFTTLFFPPSVLDKTRVPEFMRIVNTPFAVWRYPQLDFIQIEDYDWVVTENENHGQVYEQAWRDLGYPYAKQHYFAGFVLDSAHAAKEWPLIEAAAQEALAKGFAEVFIWAGTQIRRDNWIPNINART